MPHRVMPRPAARPWALISGMGLGGVGVMPVEGGIKGGAGGTWLPGGDPAGGALEVPDCDGGGGGGGDPGGV